MVAARSKSNPYTTGLIFALATAVFFGFFILGVLSLVEARREALQKAELTTQSLSRTVRDGIERTIVTYALSLDAVVESLKNPAVRAASPDLQQIILFDRAATARGLGSMLVLDDHGNVLRDSRNLTPRAVNLGDREYFAAQRQADVGLFISKPFISRLDNQWSVALSRRLTRPDGVFAGVVVGTVKLAYFKGLFEELAVGPNGVVSLFLTDGTALVRLPEQAGSIGRNFADLPLFRKLVTARSGSFDLVSSRDGIERRYIFGQIADLPLVFSIGIAFDDVLGDWRRKAVLGGLVGSLLYAAMIALASLLIRELRRRRLAEQAARDNARRFRHLAEHSSDATVLRDADGRRKYASPRFFEMIGRSREEVGDLRLAAFLHPDSQQQPRLALQKLLAGEHQVSELLQCLRPDGSTIWLDAISTGVANPDGSLAEIVTNLRDVTDRQEQQDQLLATKERLEAQALTDALTCIANRRAFDKALEQELSRAERSQRPLSIVMIDIDHFKAYNDLLGHRAGDTALQSVAACLAGGVRRPSDLLARYGGEEFALVLPETDAAGALLVAQTLRCRIEELGIPHPAHAVGVVTISAGVATRVPGNRRDIVHLADEALYAAKKGGRNSVVEAKGDLRLVV